MSYDGMLLKSVVEEINDRLQGSRIDKIHQPNQLELVVNFRGPRGNQSLLLSASSSYPRLYFTEDKMENPLNPPLFCMVLRKHLQGARFKEALQYGQDRIASLVFESKNELGDPLLLCLIIEIMGKYSNVILINQDDHKIIDALTKVGATMSSVREVLPGKLYEPKDISNKDSIFDEDNKSLKDRLSHFQQGKTFSHFLLGEFMGISKTRTREICYRAGIDESRPISSLSEEEVDQLIQTCLDYFQDLVNKNYCFCYYEEEDQFLDFSNTLLTMYGQDPHDYSSPSELLERVYLQRAHRDLMRQKSTALRKNLKRDLSKNYSKLGKLENELERSKDRDKYRVYGDLLSSKIHEIRPGSKEVEIENFYDEDLTPVRIPLDPKFSPAQNASRMYKRYQKLKRASHAIEEQIQKTQEDLSFMEEINLQLKWAETPGELDEIKESYDQVRGKKKRKSKKKKKESSSPIHYESSTGHFYVGKNNKQNDQVTFDIAGKEDLWFHVQKNPGSHVVLKSKEDQFTNKDMLRAARLAAYYSKLEGAKHVDVDYTLKKYVKRHPANTLGLVNYTNFKTVHVSGQGLPKDLTRIK